MYEWLVLIPPIIILCSAFLSRNIILSVILGIISAAVIASNFSIVGTGTIIWNHFLNQLLDKENLCIYGFLFVLGAIIALIGKTGGACAFTNIITKHLQSKKTVESSSLFLSLFLSLDDYLNALTTGCIMKSLTDKLRIPRVKLAYLIDVTASPLVVLVPVSSWIALIVKQLKLSGITLHNSPVIQADPFYAYLKSIPFMFYSFILIASAWFIVRRGISFGPMYTQEKIAEKDGNLYGGLKPRFPHDATTTSSRIDSSLSDFFLPIISLLGATLIGIPYSGGYYLFGGSNTLIESFRQTEIFPVLMFAAIFSFIISSLWALIRKKITVKMIPNFIFSGIMLMYLSAFIVFFALIFSTIIEYELHTGTYMAHILLQGVSLNFLPALIFILSILIALATGSSWGTIAISIPISIPMLITAIGISQPIMLSQIPLLFPSIGAIISGAIAGAQLSPISDPVTIASTSAGCYQIDHVKTQMPYILPAIIGACISFILAGHITTHNTIYAFLCTLIGIGITLSLIYLAHYVTQKRRLRI